MHWHQRLGAALTKFNISQKELACRIGMSEPVVSQYLTGKVRPKLDTFAAICRAAGVSADWLLGLDPSKTPADVAGARVLLQAALSALGDDGSPTSEQLIEATRRAVASGLSGEAKDASGS